MWLADVVDSSKGYDRAVGVRKWNGDSAGGTILVPLDLGGGLSVTVDVPRDVLLPGETGVMIVAAGPDAVGVLGSAEGSGLVAPSYRRVVPGAPVVEVSVLVSGDGGATFAEVDAARLGPGSGAGDDGSTSLSGQNDSSSPSAGKGIRVRVEGLSWAVPDVSDPTEIEMPFFVGYPTYAASTQPKGVHFLAESGAWRNVATSTLGGEIANGDLIEFVSMEAMLEDLSLFVATLPGEGLANEEATGSTGGGSGGGTGGGGTGDPQGEDETGGGGGSGTTGGGLGELGLPEALSLNTSEVWVDFAHLGEELGTQQRPYDSLFEGVNAVDVGGDVMVKSGGGAEAFTIAKALDIHAVGGPFVSGDPDWVEQEPGLEGVRVLGFDRARLRSYSHHLIDGAVIPDFIDLLALAGTDISVAGGFDDPVSLVAEDFEDIDVLFALQQTGDLSAAELDLIVEFVESGGGLIAFTDNTVGFPQSLDVLLEPFGISGIGGDRETTVTTITNFAHPVMSGRYGAVDNGEYRYVPESPGAINPGTSDVLAVTDAGEAAIVAVERGLGRMVVFNEDDFLEDAYASLGAGNRAIIMNALLWVNQPKVEVMLTFDDGPHGGANPDIEGNNRTQNVLDVLADNDVINDPDNGIDEMHATFFVQTHIDYVINEAGEQESLARGDTLYGPELLKRMHEAGHRIEIHTGNDGLDHEPHAVRATLPDNITEIPPYDANGDGHTNNHDGQNRLESDLIQAKLFIGNLIVDGQPVGIPTPMWVRPPHGWTFHGDPPEPFPNVVKDTYIRAELYLGPPYENGYADGHNWTIDSRDSVPLTASEVLQHLETQIREKAGPRHNHRKIIILFHDVNAITKVKANLNSYIKKIHETLRDMNMAPSYVVLPDPPFPEAIQD